MEHRPPIPWAPASAGVTTFFFPALPFIVIPGPDPGPSEGPGPTFDKVPALRPG
jgi:hypothetical protein